MFDRILEFLFSLKQVRLGPNTHLSFDFDHTVIITIVALALAALGYFSYMPQSASPAKRRALGLLRAALLVLVFLLACQPQLVMESDNPEPAAVAVWIDSSTSMALQDVYNNGQEEAKMKDYIAKLQLKPAAPASQPGADNRPTRYQLALATLADARWLKSLTQNQRVIFFTGSGRAQQVGTATNPAEIQTCLAEIAALKPMGDTTDVPTIVRDILDDVQSQRLSAIVLLTDGRTTVPGAGQVQAARQAQAAKVKVFAIPLGPQDEPFDIRVTNLRVPEKTFTKDPISARVTVAGTGLPGPDPTNVKISIYRTRPDGTVDLGAPLATGEAKLDPAHPQAETFITVRLANLDAGKDEKVTLVARAEPENTPLVERTLANNQSDGRTVEVLNNQINVLYVDGYPRWEFRYLKNELLREPTVNVTSLLLSADLDFSQDANPPLPDKSGDIFPGSLTHFPDTMDLLKKYNVLIIGDVDPTYFSPLQQNLIIDWVKKEGGGLCFIAGNDFNPERYRETPLDILLPVTPDEVDPRARTMALSNNTPFTLEVTPAGKDTNLFRFFDDPAASWEQVHHLPYMYWYKPVQGLKPGAIVLATRSDQTPGASQNNPAPMLVMRQFGAGPVLFSAYCDTWRWRRETGEPLYQSYWLQLCRLLYANKKLGQNQFVDFTTQNNRLELGGQIEVSLTVKNPSLTGQLPKEIPVLVVDKTTGQTVQTITLSPTTPSTQSGALPVLTGTAAARQLGNFDLQIQPGILSFNVNPLSLTVESPQRETQEVTIDLASLQALAGTNAAEPDDRGGVYFPFEQDTALPAKPASTKPALENPRRSELPLALAIPDRHSSDVKRQPEDLWNKPIALILVVLLAAAEWLLRKSAGLI